MKSEIDLFPKNVILYWNLMIKLTFLPKTKMVRMVHRNLSYNTDSKFSDPRRESWELTIYGGEKIEIVFWGPTLEFWGLFWDQNDFLKYSRGARH